MNDQEQLSLFDIQDGKPVNESELSKAVSLFQFIKELNKLKQKPILNISTYQWSCFVSDLPDDPENITLNYQDRTDDEDESSDNESVLLSIHKPEYEKCPTPHSAIIKWLEPGWDSFVSEVRVKEKIAIEVHDSGNANYASNNRYEFFNNDPTRVRLYNQWFEERKAWTTNQYKIKHTVDLFTDLYRQYFEMKKDSESLEMVVANGIICDKYNPEIRHPLLTKRIRLEYEPTNNIVSVIETNTTTELYSIVFQEMTDINHITISQLREDLIKNDYHPLDRNTTPNFIKTLAHQLSSKSVFSDNGIPEKWMHNNRILLYMDPCFIVRKRLDGTIKAVEQILEDIQEKGTIPAPIKDIVSGGKKDTQDNTTQESVEEQLAAVGGESIDILLSKEANREQLEIAKRIELFNAVLVQGPPGTGKTHTIANLLGHFLAQGKSVLVTSHTQKALRVLKEKVAPGLQNLCVSVLEDSNADMEKSIDGISGYMAKATSYELKRDMERIALERQGVIDDLADVRRKMFQLINRECNCIVCNGEEISPSKAAAFVFEHSEDLSYIPGRVRSNAQIPLSISELSELYQSNRLLSSDDEAEISSGIPSPTALLDLDEFCRISKSITLANKELQTINASSCWSVERNNNRICFNNKNRIFSVDIPGNAQIQKLNEYLNSIEKFELWMKYAIVAGKIGGNHRCAWESLIEIIEQTYTFAEELFDEQLNNAVTFSEGCDKTHLTKALNELIALFKSNGKISSVKLRFNKEARYALENVLINGATIKSSNDCDTVLHALELESYRNKCAMYWDKLLSSHGVPAFYSLNSAEPERVAFNWIAPINKCLNWYNDVFASICGCLSDMGIDANSLFVFNPLDTDMDVIEKIFDVTSHDLPIICDACKIIIDIAVQEHILEHNRQILKSGYANSKLCSQIIKANDSLDTELYRDSINKLTIVFDKITFRKRREELLNRLEIVAPDWANAILNRDGIHGLNIMPSTIEDAWRWKQLSVIIEDITAQPFTQLQKKSVELSKEYRKKTALFAEKSAWYHLLRKTEGDIDMRQALQGWKLAIKKIGKGNGKNAPLYRAKARELMGKCQSAVPAWIMPINRAMESLNPKENAFDIVIIDEASQSDISSLAILYMGKKLIVVGDDKQVSPMAIGVDSDRIKSLQDMYINDNLPNSHLYDAKTSIYDIAGTTFQPLMLREHFRCVPDIIGFSNMLSYDNKILPLRDASTSSLLPAVVNYRVNGGERIHNKTNPNEANTIVALLMACLEQPEYDNKSFGFISLLGDEQAKVIERMLEMNINHKILQDRNILCGNASNFQGDERDVVFLSMVDSGYGKGPLNLQGFGSDDAYKKRYNVAASRARDQLWVVDSLDSSVDLKPGDIRKRLIDYSMNPQSLDNKHKEIEELSESPFEKSVATSLSDRGYHIKQQWQVGGYRLDMVVIYQNSMVAIECDGERYHSGEAKIREDMERQTILERLGWRFIRIRGSEYYRDSDKTIERVIKDLTELGIKPEDSDNITIRSGNSELLDRVKQRAVQILEERFSNSAVDYATIEYALNAQNSVVKAPQPPDKPQKPVVPIQQKPSKPQPSRVGHTVQQESDGRIIHKVVTNTSVKNKRRDPIKIVNLTKTEDALNRK